MEYSCNKTLKSESQYSGASVETRTRDLLFTKQSTTAKLLKKLSLPTLAALSNLSKSYLSQVKNGKRPPSKKLLDALEVYANNQGQHKSGDKDYFALFLQSRKALGVTPASYRFYLQITTRFFTDLNPSSATESNIESYLMQFSNPGNRARHFQVIKTFYRWRELGFGIPSPIRTLKAPKIPNLILPSLSVEQVLSLIEKSSCIRDKAIIALFAESGLRLTELTNVCLEDIDWELKAIKVMGKGRKEALAPFGSLSETSLKEWLSVAPVADNIWGLNKWGITIMLRRLEQKTGLPCNPHTFRRTFACLLRKSGIDTMTIKELGRWESLEMVQRYTRSINFRDSLKFYKAPLSPISTVVDSQ